MGAELIEDSIRGSCSTLRQILRGSSLGFIGNASAEQGGGEDVQPSRGVFDKETRRKPLAFAADAYGISMPLLHAASDGESAGWCIRSQTFGRLAGSVTFWQRFLVAREAIVGTLNTLAGRHAGGVPLVRGYAAALRRVETGTQHRELR